MLDSKKITYKAKQTCSTVKKNFKAKQTCSLQEFKNQIGKKKVYLAYKTNLFIPKKSESKVN
jgi:hypothetical protein